MKEPGLIDDFGSGHSRDVTAGIRGDLSRCLSAGCVLQRKCLLFGPAANEVSDVSDVSWMASRGVVLGGLGVARFGVRFSSEVRRSLVGELRYEKSLNQLTMRLMLGIIKGCR